MLARKLRRAELPGHVALVMDGNRRWARQTGLTGASDGHRAGAEHLEDVLRWLDRLGIRYVTAWVASSDNIRRREADEVAFLMRLAETVIADHVRRSGRWQVRVIGQLDLVPDSTRHALKAAEEATADASPGCLTIAIGYGGREEIVDAVAQLVEDGRAAGLSLAQIADSVSEEAIGRRLSTVELPHPDLVIRTSGERRLSDFLMWQSVDAELLFVDALWPAFRQIDLLRALRVYSARRARAADRDITRGVTSACQPDRASAPEPGQTTAP
jgi:short-chain Z-isoprenyl diphosphate synthase